MIAYVAVAHGRWSIANIDESGHLEWWCGKHGFVSPNSEYWQVFGSCWNVCFHTLAAARRISRAKGWGHPK